MTWAVAVSFQSARARRGRAASVAPGTPLGRESGACSRTRKGSSGTDVRSQSDGLGNGMSALAGGARDVKKMRAATAASGGWSAVLAMVMEREGECEQRRRGRFSWN